MTSETVRAKSKLAVLASSFDDLEDLLEPLLSQSLPETLVGLEPIQQAKLQTLLPYLVYDLIFIYLKTRGIDPKTHPVISELDRVKQYFGKVANAESAPDKPATKLDKDAASRFIKHAIAQVSKQLPQDEPTTAASASPTPAPVASIPIKVTSKMLARAKYQDELREEAARSSDEEGLQVVNDASDTDNGGAMDIDQSGMKSSEQILSIPADSDQARARNKRKHSSVDPFAGYGDEPSMLAHATLSYSGSPKFTTTEMNSELSTPLSIDEDSQRSSLSTTHSSKKKKSKKPKKIQRR